MKYIVVMTDEDERVLGISAIHDSLQLADNAARATLYEDVDRTITRTSVYKAVEDGNPDYDAGPVLYFEHAKAQKQTRKFVVGAASAAPAIAAEDQPEVVEHNQDPLLV